MNMDSLINDRLFADFGSVFGTSAGHFSHGKEAASNPNIPEWKKNRSAAMSFGRVKFEHTSPCRICGSYERWTRRFITGTQVNKCAGCDE